MRRIFGSRKDEVTGGCRKLHNKQLCDLHSSPSIIRMIKSETKVRACTKNGDKRKTCRLLVGKPEGKRPLGRPRYRWWIKLRWMLQI
jgi:hypothetical protein